MNLRKTIIVQTPGICDLIREDVGFAEFVSDSLFNRHFENDWGEVDKEDWKENDFSLKKGFRVLSAYTYHDEKNHRDIKIWIITEADRSTTTVLFPDEY